MICKKHNCQEQYISETENNLGKRITHHRGYINKNETKKGI